ncbi:hypothetical protein DAEQUDRAFT_792082 [Daedalea quercina L-15889]|uniref:Uncharacterized protein n=1 Tax=Daedalea quercina L-15889 TaxID=1314783 RepID=A0A165P6A3_9APHY|nr:hypothetical protein DAEQUDRAFT_792082 [Daedalea quercina L-15889]
MAQLNEGEFFDGHFLTIQSVLALMLTCKSDSIRALTKAQVHLQMSQSWISKKTDNSMEGKTRDRMGKEDQVEDEWDNNNIFKMSMMIDKDAYTHEPYFDCALANGSATFAFQAKSLTPRPACQNVAAKLGEGTTRQQARHMCRLRPLLTATESGQAARFYNVHPTTRVRVRFVWTSKADATYASPTWRHNREAVVRVSSELKSGTTTTTNSQALDHSANEYGGEIALMQLLFLLDSGFADKGLHSGVAGLKLSIGTLDAKKKDVDYLHLQEDGVRKKRQICICEQKEHCHTGSESTLFDQVEDAKLRTCPVVGISPTVCTQSRKWSPGIGRVGTRMRDRTKIEMFYRHGAANNIEAIKFFLDARVRRGRRARDRARQLPSVPTASG